MIIIERKETDPFFNIAAEEYFFKSTDDELFMLWRNKPSVIIGKHQNANAEINQHYVLNHNIPVIRRISGGGTVYHDTGNINYTLVKKGVKDKLIDYRENTRVIIDFLKTMNLDAVLVGKSDIKIGEMKISGNAEHIYKGKVLHHGTLLYNTSLSNLYDALKTSEHHYSDKAIQSNRSRICNIVDILQGPVSTEDFIKLLKSFLSGYYPETTEYILTDNDHRKIRDLVATKYSTWEWNYGYSPDYQINGIIKDQNAEIKYNLCVSKGIIQDVVFSPENSVTRSLTRILPGSPHHLKKLKEQITNLGQKGLLEHNIEHVIDQLF